MTYEEVVAKIAEAIAHYEGFYLEEEKAKQRGVRWPTLAQRHCNPGNIRRWQRDGVPYPQENGYVDFLRWAKEQPQFPPEKWKEEALKEGWRVLRLLVSRYVAGHFHGGKSPSLLDFFRVYAPSADRNHPQKYAEFVSEFSGIPVDVPLESWADSVESSDGGTLRVSEFR